MLDCHHPPTNEPIESTSFNALLINQIMKLFPHIPLIHIIECKWSSNSKIALMVPSIDTEPDWLPKVTTKRKALITHKPFSPAIKITSICILRLKNRRRSHLVSRRRRRRRRRRRFKFFLLISREKENPKAISTILGR